jgi:hypothetical protein
MSWYDRWRQQGSALSVVTLLLGAILLSSDSSLRRELCRTALFSTEGIFPFAYATSTEKQSKEERKSVKAYSEDLRERVLRAVD